MSAAPKARRPMLTRRAGEDFPSQQKSGAEEPRLTRLLAAAEAHGEESEPDHEVGDLQMVLRECWQRMTPEARREVYDSDFAQDLVAEWGPGPLGERR